MPVSLKTLAKFRLSFEEVQQIRGGKVGTESAEDYTFCTEKGMKIIDWRQDSCTYRNRSSSYLQQDITCSAKRSLVQYCFSECACPY